MLKGTVLFGSLNAHRTVSTLILPMNTTLGVLAADASHLKVTRGPHIFYTCSWRVMQSRILAPMWKAFSGLFLEQCLQSASSPIMLSTKSLRSQRYTFLSLVALKTDTYQLKEDFLATRIKHFRWRCRCSREWLCRSNDIAASNCTKAAFLFFNLPPSVSRQGKWPHSIWYNAWIRVTTHKWLVHL